VPLRAGHQPPGPPLRAGRQPPGPRCRRVPVPPRAAETRAERALDGTPAATAATRDRGPFPQDAEGSEGGHHPSRRVFTPTTIYGGRMSHN